MINCQGRLKWAQTLCLAPAQPPCCTHHCPLRRDENIINSQERNGAMRMCPKAARSSLATFSKCSTKPGGQLSILISLCHQQAGLSSTHIPHSHLSTWVLPPKTSDLSTVPEGIPFYKQSPQIVLPRWGWDLGNQHYTFVAFTSMSASPLNSTQEVSLATLDATIVSSHHPTPPD